MTEYVSLGSELIFFKTWGLLGRGGIELALAGGDLIFATSGCKLKTQQNNILNIWPGNNTGGAQKIKNSPGRKKLVKSNKLQKMTKKINF